MKGKLVEELEFCLDIWEKKGYCKFGGHTNCEECGTPYILLKLINGEVLHGDIDRLDLNDWRSKVSKVKGKPC